MVVAPLEAIEDTVISAAVLATKGKENVVELLFPATIIDDADVERVKLIGSARRVFLWHDTTLFFKYQMDTD